MNMKRGNQRKIDISNITTEFHAFEWASTLCNIFSSGKLHSFFFCRPLLSHLLFVHFSLSILSIFSLNFFYVLLLPCILFTPPFFLSTLSNLIFSLLSSFFLISRFSPFLLCPLASFSLFFHQTNSCFFDFPCECLSSEKAIQFCRQWVSCACHKQTH